MIRLDMLTVELDEDIQFRLNPYGGDESKPVLHIEVEIGDHDLDWISVQFHSEEQLWRLVMKATSYLQQRSRG